jgi:glycosyltransferase involved in cell wall biosynthesis
MKVLHILNELKHSGAEVMLQLAYGNFKRRGIDSHILSTGDEVGEYAVVLQNSGYRIHHIPFRKRPGFFVDVRNLIKKEQFKAVHIHTERAFVWYVLLAKFLNVPTVIRTFHNVFLFSSYLRLKRKVQRKLSRNMCGAIHAAISDSVLSVEKERFNNDCVLIGNWTDVHKFRPPTDMERTEARRQYHLGPDDFSVSIVGACSPVKNHLAGFAAVKKANDILHGKRVVLLHVGTGFSLREEELYVKRNGIGQYCRFIGALDDVRPCLYAADAFVMTSDWEGLPIAAVEAMSTGLPAILYNVYGLRDLLKDGRGGLLIDPREDCLVEALLTMSHSLELRKKYGQDAREKIVNNYSLERSVDRLIRLYTMGS